MALGIFVIGSGFELGFGEWREPGPGFIVVLSGGMLFFLSALWLVMTLLKKWGMEASRRFFPESDSYKRVLLTLSSLLVFALLLERVGFMISSLVLMIFLFRAIEPQRWRLTILLAVGITVLCVMVFQVWLRVQFPEGPISIYAIMKWIR